MTWESVLIIASAITSVVAAVIAIRKSPHETQALDGDAATKFANAAGLTADQNAKLQVKMKELEGRIETLEKENVKLKGQVAKFETENNELRDWADCLCGQVKELGGRPVLLRASGAKK